MAFMHQFSYKYVIGLILVGAALLGTTQLQEKRSEKTPDADVQALDAKLLTDLKHQELQIDGTTAGLMATNNISEDELRALFDIDNLNYDKCESGNCHYTSYTIEGKLKNGKEVLFKLDSGEDGNVLRELTLR